jgi:hypothetical protein
LVLAFTSVVTSAIPVDREVEAARTVALVLALTEAVPTVIAAANDVEAVNMAAFVLAFTAAAMEEVAELFQTALAIEVVEALA